MKPLIENSVDSFQTWLHRSYISPTLKDKLENANVLLVPIEGYAENADLIYFPVRTEELFQFLRDANHTELSVDICIEDKDYKELTLHADLLIISDVIVQIFVAPLVVQLLAKYIKQRLSSREKVTDVKSKVTIVDENSGRSVAISYRGPAVTYEVMIKAVTGLARQQDSARTDDRKKNAPKRNRGQKSKKR